MSEPASRVQFGEAWMAVVRTTGTPAFASAFSEARQRKHLRRGYGGLSSDSASLD